MASSQEKILAYHIARLQDKRPDVQMSAIKELEAMGSAAEGAMTALKECFEKANDNEVKQAARQAAYNIFMAAKESKSKPESGE